MSSPRFAGLEPSGIDRNQSKPKPGLPDYCYHKTMQPCPNPASKGHEPSGYDRCSLRLDAGLPDHFYHESHLAMPHGRSGTLCALKGQATERCPAHPTFSCSFILSLGSRITTIMNPRTRNFGFTNPGNHAASYPEGARALGKYGSLPYSPNFF
jgi:hypothetical protein